MAISVYDLLKCRGDDDTVRLFFGIKEAIRAHFGKVEIAEYLSDDGNQVIVEVGSHKDHRTHLKKCLAQFDEKYWMKRHPFSFYRDRREKRIWEDLIKKDPGLAPPCARAKGLIVVVLSDKARTG